MHGIDNTQYQFTVTSTRIYAHTLIMWPCNCNLRQCQDVKSQSKGEGRGLGLIFLISSTNKLTESTHDSCYHTGLKQDSMQLLTH